MKIKITFFSVISIAFLSLNMSVVFAKCESNYGGGQTCVYNKSFSIDKDVKLEGDNTWNEHKLEDVEEDDVVIFRIRIKNEGEVEVDDMKYKDTLPDALERIGGKGLTEEWDDFKPGDVKTFEIKTKVKDSEFDRENFEKCAVNRVELKYGDKYEGSDSATVCYSSETTPQITELPETGAQNLALALGGVVCSTFGILVRRNFTRR